MALPSPSSLLILSIKWLNWKPWGPDFAFQWFLITLIWFLNVEGNCIEISTSIYQFSTTQFMAVYIPTHLFISQICLTTCGLSFIVASTWWQLEWLCQLSNSLMLIEDSKNATPPLQRMWTLFVRQCQVQSWATWGHFDRVYILYQCNTITSYDHDNPLHKPHFNSKKAQPNSKCLWSEKINSQQVYTTVFSL